MQIIKISSISLAALFIAACSGPKKTTSSKASTPPVATAPATTAPATIAKSVTGIFAPGSEELTAIQAKYKDVTMTTLTDGYTIYTGVCTKCHGAKSIYRRPEEEWPHIIDDMALKAKITDVQKDAVLKYVLAIKATQPKEAMKNPDSAPSNFGPGSQGK